LRRHRCAGHAVVGDPDVHQAHRAIGRRLHTRPIRHWPVTPGQVFYFPHRPRPRKCSTRRPGAMPSGVTGCTIRRRRWQG
jgi:hypothetical protein